MVHLTDGYTCVEKCLKCGYAHKPVGDILHQNKHDYVLNVTVLSSLKVKQAQVDLYQPVDEQLYNAIISSGKDSEEARKEVIRDLDLKDENLEYFNMKIDYLGGY
jgi:hypothetical protein